MLVSGIGRIALASYLLVAISASSERSSIILNVPSVANNRSLINLDTDSPIVRREGFYEPGDGGGGTYVFAQEPCRSPDNGVCVDSKTRSGSWHLETGAPITPKLFGAHCDYSAATGRGSDDTIALQAAIDATEAKSEPNGTSSRILRQFGSCVTGPLAITKPLTYVGEASGGALLVLLPGSTRPLITISLSYGSADYYRRGGPPGSVTIAGLYLASGNNKDAAGLNVADGIRITKARDRPVYTHVDLQNVTISHMPADGLSGVGLGANGYVTARNLYLIGNGRDNLNLTSNYDWRLAQTDFSEAVRDNILISDSGGVECSECNSYAAGRYDINVFNDNPSIGINKWLGGAVDTAAQDGMRFYNTSRKPQFVLFGVNFGDNGKSAPGKYDDISLASGTNGGLSLVGCSFGAVHAISTNSSTRQNLGTEDRGDVPILVSGTTFAGPRRLAIDPRVRILETPVE